MCPHYTGQQAPSGRMLESRPGTEVIRKGPGTDTLHLCTGAICLADGRQLLRSFQERQAFHLVLRVQPDSFQSIMYKFVALFVEDLQPASQQYTTNKC